MNINCTDNYIEVTLPNRIESANHNEIQDEFEKIISDNPDKPMVLDASTMEYVSSAGLRILLALHKRNKIASIKNVSKDVYTIFDITGFTDIFNIELFVNDHAIEPDVLIGEDPYGFLYQIDADSVVRIYFDNVSDESVAKGTEYSKALMNTEVSNGLAMNTLKTEAGTGTEYAVDEIITIDQYIKDHPESRDEAISNVITELKKVHNVDNSLESDLVRITSILTEKIDKNAKELSSSEVAKLRDYVALLSRNNSIIFMNVNERTIIYPNQKPVFVNLSLLCYGNPLFELAGIRRNLLDYETFFGYEGEEKEKAFMKFMSMYIGTSDEEIISAYDIATKDLANLMYYLDRPKNITDSALMSSIEKIRQNILNDYDNKMNLLQSIKAVQDGENKDKNESLRINIKERTASTFLKKKTLLKDINMNIYPGEMVLLVGGSGAGKTTFLNAVTGYEKANASIHKGKIDLYKDYESIKHRIAFAPQQDLLRDEDTVYNTLLNAGQMRLPIDTPENKLIEEVEHMMELFGLSDLRHNSIRTLSGGQRKRASIAVEFISDPILFFLDEPDSGLDGVMARALMDDLRVITGKSKIIIVISHAPDRVIDLFDKIIILAKSESDGAGHLAFYGSPKEAKEFFERDTIEQILRIVNRKSEGGEGRADEFINKYNTWK